MKFVVLDDKELMMDLLSALLAATSRNMRVLTWISVGDGLYLAELPNTCRFLLSNRLTARELHITDNFGFRGYVLPYAVYWSDFFALFTALETYIQDQLTSYAAGLDERHVIAGERQFLEALIKRMF